MLPVGAVEGGMRDGNERGITTGKVVGVRACRACMVCGVEHVLFIQIHEKATWS